MSHASSSTSALSRTPGKPSRDTKNASVANWKCSTTDVSSTTATQASRAASRAASHQAPTSSKSPWVNRLWYNPSVQPDMAPSTSQAPTQAPAPTPPAHTQAQVQTVRTLQVSASNKAVAVFES
ncbi:hypothetical protein FA10DRAFT_267254 [Acaromyces ingoldii]|uniref:Uncharacterized protein n=1 Tax=Acaromyces ingoldii TaxID=215250 RepID=A0A316YNM4_9BASI|nr:hypothetical protein FA10DRAFT_267254 [Acaromyces ingoldii]PWN90821.1 hypothetical protein FA10DRAFT_267254 [Acaromyces ingoldii]